MHIRKLSEDGWRFALLRTPDGMMRITSIAIDDTLESLTRRWSNFEILGLTREPNVLVAETIRAIEPAREAVVSRNALVMPPKE